MNCQVKDELVSQLIALNTNSICSVLIWYMGTNNARKCNNDVRAYTPRSNTTGRRDTKANRARRQDRSRPVAPASLGKRNRSEVRGQNGFISIISNSKCFDLR